jgi:uncharacterized protein
MSGPVAAPFLTGLEDGRLPVQRCAACGTHQLPPRILCTTCGSTDLAWTDASGYGKVVSFTILHRAPDAVHRERIPYVYALIELAEGPVVVSTVVDCEPSGIRVGQPVRLLFEPTEDGCRHVFTVIGDGSSSR